MSTVDAAVEARARLSLGQAHIAIHGTVIDALRDRGCHGTIADVGCGRGDLQAPSRTLFDRYIGIDAARYDVYPEGVPFLAADLDRDPLPLDDGAVDVAAAVEVIEHLENPRAFYREMTRITRPGGWIAITTPNQQSVLSLLSLVVKGRYAAFGDGDYPAHRTALLEIDLRRLAAECGWRNVDVIYTRWGRLPLTGGHYPAAIASLAPRALSDNVLVIGQR